MIKLQYKCNHNILAFHPILYVKCPLILHVTYLSVDLEDRIGVKGVHVTNSNRGLHLYHRDHQENDHLLKRVSISCHKHLFVEYSTATIASGRGPYKARDGFVWSNLE